MGLKAKSLPGDKGVRKGCIWGKGKGVMVRGSLAPGGSVDRQ